MGEDRAVFDPEPLQRLEAASPGITVAVLGVFRRDLAAFASTADALRRAGDAEAMRRAAHKLKGAAAAVGAREVQACSFQLEQACRETGAIPPEGVDALVSAANRLLQRLAAA